MFQIASITQCPVLAKNLIAVGPQEHVCKKDWPALILVPTVGMKAWKKHKRSAANLSALRLEL